MLCRNHFQNRSTALGLPSRIWSTRNYEPFSWRQQEENERERMKKKEVDVGDAIAELEARTAKRKQEMDTIEKLDELKALSGRQEHVAVEDILAARRHVESEAEKADEEELASIVFETSQPKPAPALAVGGSIPKLSMGISKLPSKAKKNVSGMSVVAKAKPQETSLGSLIGSYES